MHRPSFRASLVLFSLSTAAAVGLHAQTTAVPSERRAEIIGNYLHVPLAFEKQGTAGDDRYVARGQGYLIGLQGGTTTIVRAPAAGEAGKALSLGFAGGRSARAVPGPELPGKVNYIHGNDPRRWQLGQSTFARITYPNVYPGIDVVYYGNQQQLEFDLVLKPGADPRAIRLKIDGASKLAIDGEGALRIADGDLRIALPKIYQEINGAKKNISGGYVLRGSDEVAFNIDRYDRTRPLVIDPTIVYAALIGSNSNAAGVALDSSGNVYITGYTQAGDFPVLNAFQSGLANGQDGFVTEINPAGTALVYSTYIGGSANDSFQSIAVDSNGNAWVAGGSSSPDFPLKNATQATYGGNGDAVLLELTPTGTLQFSTFLGGSANDQANGVAVDGQNNAYVTGYTSGAFPTTSGAFQSANEGTNNVFVAKFNSSDAETYATLMGGTGSDVGNGIAADQNGNAYVTGSATSAAFNAAPTGGAQTTNAGGGDAFIAKLKADGTQMLYFTFLGGPGADTGNAIAVDSSGDAFIAGSTSSPALPTAGTLQIPYGGESDGLVAELNPAGTQFTWLTYVGGNLSDSLQSLSLDGLGNVYVAGYTFSTVLPVTSAVQPALGGNGVSAFQTTNSASLWSAFDTNVPGGVTDISADSATAGTIVVSTGQGIYLTTNGGASFTQQLNNGSVSTLARSPAKPTTIYAANGTQIAESTDDGTTWNVTGTSPVSAAFSATQIVADPLTANTAYVFVSNAGSGIYKTTNAGAAWSPANAGLPGLNVTALTGGLDGSLYAALPGAGIYKSTNQASSWVAVNNGLPAGIGPQLHSLSVSTSNPSIVALALPGAGLYITTNGGTSWSKVTTYPGAGSTQVAISTADSSTAYVVTPAGVVFETQDGGMTFNPVETGLTATSITEIAFDPTSASHVFAVTGTVDSGLIAKLNPAASAPAWLTYFGGGFMNIFGVAADGKGDVFAAGFTSGSNFPGTLPAIEPNLGTSTFTAFVTEISDATQSCSYTLTPASAVLAGNAQNVTAQIVSPSGCAWTAASDQSWAVVGFGASGSGTGVFSVQVAANTSGSTRTAHIMAGGQTATLTQAASSCTYTLNPSSFSLPSAAGSGFASLTTAAGCPWAITDTYGEAITIVSPASGTGSATIGFNIAANEGLNTRSFTIPVVSSQIAVSQAGTCTFSLSPSSATFSSAAATGSVLLSANNAGCAFSASSQLGGLTITSGASGSGTTTIRYSIAANTGDPRAGTLTIAGIPFPVSQAGAGQFYLMSTIAGGEQPAPAVNATAAALPFPQAVAVDSAGNAYIASQQQSAIFRLSANGVLTRVAGTGINGFSGDGGPAVGAQLGSPNALAFDRAGNLYIADGGNNHIRRIAPNGFITTIAGTGAFGFAGDGGPATSAQFENPNGLAVDSNGNIYVADSGNNRVREISGGTITTVAGNGTFGYSGDSGAATSAQLANPLGVALDSQGNLYIADSNNNRVRKVAGGIITTVAGSGVCCQVVDGIPATSAYLNGPRSVTFDSANNLYIADTNDNRVRLVAENGIISTVAGSGFYAFSGDGGAPANAAFRSPFALAIDASDNLWIADYNNQRIRQVSGGIIRTVAGGGGLGEPGPAPLAGLGGPSSVVIGSSNVYFAEPLNNRIRMIAPGGAISTIAGTGVPGYSGDGGAATSAMLNAPESLAIDKNGNLYFIDSNNYRLRKIDTSGNISTVAGNGTCCYSGDGGPATSAQINYGQGLAVDASGNLYIADSNNQRIREVSGGNITTVAGNGTSGFSGDNGPATSAQLNNPDGIALDGNGNLYIADSNNNRIRKVSGGTITTFAGNGSCCFAGDGGPATSAQFNEPRAVAFDGAGNLYIADTNDQRIREVTTGGTLVTVAGNGAFGNQGDGGPAISGNLRSPLGLTVDSFGNIYVADTYNDAIRLLTPASAAPVLTIASSHSGNFSAGGGGSYTLTVTLAAASGPPGGMVTVTEFLPAGLSLNSMSGTGWSCTANSCNRSDAVPAGTSYPAITVSVNVGGTAPLQVTNQVTVTGGGAPETGASDLTLITPNSPAPPVLISPANGATNVSVLPTLTWSASTEAVSYDVYFGTSSTPPLLGNTTGLSFTPATLSALLATNTTYFWQVVAKNGAGTGRSAIFSFTTYPAGFCTYALTPGAASFGANGGSGSVSVTAPAGCLYTAVSSQPWLAITSDPNGSGNGTVDFLAAPNAGGQRSATLTIGGQTFTVTQTEAYLISSIVGPQQPPSAAPGTSVVLPPPTGVAVDSAGNAYIAGQNLNAVYKLDAGGVLTRFAGTGVCGFSGDNGPAVTAGLCQPGGVAVDASGNVYIADSGNARIREVTSNGTITTIAGGANCCNLGDGGPATSAFLSYPQGVAVDSAGNIYIADSNNNRVRKVTGGMISTVAGNNVCCTLGDGGPATGAFLADPGGVAVDAQFNIYIADRNNNRVREVLASNGNITTFAGNNACCNVNDGGPATNAFLANPTGVAVDSAGNLYIADTNNNRIREVSTNGVIATLAGNGGYGYTGDGGEPTATQLRAPQGIAMDASGNLWIADTNNQRIRQVRAGTINTVAGSARTGDGGPLPFAALFQPGSVAKDAAGNLYIADSNSNRVRMITPSGAISTIAGTGVQGYSGDGAAATSAMLNEPQAVALDQAGNLYIYDSSNFRIRMLSGGAGGNITTVAGNGTCCYSGDGGPAASAQIGFGYSLAFDKSNNLYIADSNNHRVRKVSGGTITTVAGNGNAGFSGDGAAATSAQLNNPRGVTVDGNGNIFIADSNNQRIREVTGGNITTVAGNGNCCFAGDGGPATSAQFNNPQDVKVDAAGNLYIVDTYDDRIREVTTSGTILTLAGGNYGYTGDGGPALSAGFRNPQSITLDSSGNIYVADNYNNAIRVLTPVGTNPVLTITSTHTGSFNAGGSGSYTLTVSNASLAATTSGTVTVTEMLPASLTLNSMSGSGWTCTANSCTNSNPLAGGASYGAITVSVNVSGTAPLQVTNQATVAGGGATGSGAEDLTLIVPNAPSAPVLISPAKGATNVSVLPTLTWTASTDAVSYDVYFGSSSTPPLLANTTGISYVPATLSSLLTTNTTYFWQVVAKNNAGSTPSAIFSFTTYPNGFCTYALNPPAASFGGSGGSGSLTVTAPAGCVFTVVSSQPFLSVTSAASGSGNGTVNYSVAANVSGSRSATLTIGGQTFTVTQTGAYLISSIVGPQQPPTTATGTSVVLPPPTGVAVDSAGNAYITGQNLNAVYKLDASGVLTRFAGNGVCGFSGDSGPAVTAGLCNPGGVAVDASGNVYIADSGNGRIREVSSSGVITTVAGGAGCCNLNDGGPATSAFLNYPLAVAIDSVGSIYIADTNNNRVRKVTAGTITTVAGNNVCCTLGDGGPATGAFLANPGGVAVDAQFNIYIADRNNNRVREVLASNGNITTVAGNGVCCNVNDGGPATNAWLANPQGVALDSAGNLYIADSNNNRIREVSANGVIATVAGNGGYGYTGDGGAAKTAQLRAPAGVAVDGSGNLWIADTNNQRIRQVKAATINTVAGSGITGDGGPLPFAALYQPSSVAKDAAGNLYIADANANRIRLITPSGSISTVAGTGVQGFSGDGGPAISAMLNEPQAVALDKSGNLYILDSNNNRVRMVSGGAGGNITTIAGNGTCCYSGDGGPATSAQINFANGLALDSSNNIYIADSNNHRIRKVSGGTITTVAGNGNAGFSGDGAAATSAQLNFPRGVTVDGNGNIFIADSNNQRVREVTGGNITTVAGNGNCCFAGDGGPATSAQFNNPQDVKVDAAGNLYIVDTYDDRIREVTTSGTILTLAGGNYGYTGDGGPALSAGFRNPQSITLDSSGNIYVADNYNNAIRVLTPVGTNPVLTITSTHTGSFNAGGSGSYTLTVSNASLAATTSGTVTVTEMLPASLTLNSMSGSGWTCTANSCTNSNPLAGGASYGAITVSVNVSGTAPLQVTNQATVAGGGATGSGAEDLTLIVPNAPSAPVLISPAKGATNVSVLPTLTWTASTDAVSYDVYFGSSSTPPLLANTTGISYVPATLSSLLTTNTTYFWQVVAKNNAGSTPSAIFSFTTYPNGFCTYALNPPAASFGGSGGSGSLTVTAPAGCVFTVVSSQPFLSVTSAASGSGNGTVNYSVAANVSGSRSATLTIGGQTFTVTQTGAYLISSIIGPQQPPGAAPGTSVALPQPTGIAVDSAGNTYIAGSTLNAVYKLDTSGVLTRFAGTGVCGSSGDGQPATSAQLCIPNGVAADKSGNVYIADSFNGRVRMVAPNGIIATVAGGSCCSLGDGGPATSAQLSYPLGVGVDAAGNLYIADTGNNRVRKVTGGMITTVAGNGTNGFSGDNSAATSAELASPQGVAVDANLNIYIADRANNRVREVLASNGNIITFAGSGVCCNVNDGGPATNAWLANPQGVGLDSLGNLYIADSNNNRIRIVSGGNITTFAGTGGYDFQGDGGAAANAQFENPQGVAVDAAGDVFIADTNNLRVRVVTSGKINTIAGGGAPLGDGGPIPFATLDMPGGVAKDATGNIYIADTSHNRVRMITPAGAISTAAGTGVEGFSGDGAAATSAKLARPQAVALDKSGNLYIYDSGNSRIRKVSGGTITTVAGNGTCCYSGDNGPATSAQIGYGFGLAIDGSNNIYIADSNNGRIREVSGGTITTVAGGGPCCNLGDGGPATSATLNYPNGVAVDGSGNIFIADTNQQRIRKVTGGTITTVAGNGNCCFAGDGGPATSAQFNNPRDVKVDAAGNLYIADSNDQRIREVLASGTIGTLAGTGFFGFIGDGGPALGASFGNPQALAVDGAGNIYVADSTNNAIRLLTPGGTNPVLTIASAHTGSFLEAGPGSYSLTVANTADAGSTSGTVTVVEILPAGLTLNSMSGTNWVCVGNSCTRNDPLSAGSPYEPINVSVNVVAGTPSQVTNRATVSGGGAPAGGAEDLTLVTPVPQTIAFGSVPTQLLGNPPFTLVASASSGLTVAFASNSTGICTVSGATITLVAAGTCSITATQPGDNATYAAAAPVTVTFTVDPPFADLGDQSPNIQGAIDLMATYGITVGCSTTPFDYCPDETVTRGQMAVFIVRGIYGNNNFPYTMTPYFTDVPANAQFFKYIQKMKDLGITSGETPTTYGPNDTVTRGQMAVFIIRARYGTGVTFNFTQTPYFADVPLGAQFFQYIQKMKDVGITSGETATTYGPNDPVTRGQMAVFIMRGTFNLLLPATAPVLSAVSPVTGTAGKTVTVTVTGKNTSFAQGTTVVTAGAGVTVQNVTVNSATSLTAQLVIAANATLGPESLVATTGTQEAVAPNGFTITSDPAAGVLAYFTGNNTTVDSVSGLSGTLMNGATYAPATSRTQGLPDAQAFSLIGTNSYVQAASGETATVSGARTLVAWVYPNSGAGLGMPILTGGTTNAAGDIFGITGTSGTCSAGGQYQLYIDHAGTCYVSDISLTPNTWSLVAVTFDGANAVFFINGVASVTVPAQMFNYGLATYEIGGNTIGGTSTAPSFSGLLSEVQIYGRALTPAEIQGIYAP